MRHLFAALALVAGTLGAGELFAASADVSASTISVYAGGAFMRQYSDVCYDGYYYDCGGYYRSDTYSGPELGADVHLVMPGGLLIDLSAEHARVSDYGDAFLEQQFTAGLGYQGRVGPRASWFVEGFYQHYRLGESYFGCDYSCNGWYNANGGGVKGGFTWPFVDRWFGTIDLRISYLGGDPVDIVQAKFGASLGYIFTDNLSLSVGVSSQAEEATNDRNNYYTNNNAYGYYYGSNDVLSHTSVFLKLSAHF